MEQLRNRVRSRPFLELEGAQVAAAISGDNLLVAGKGAAYCVHVAGERGEPQARLDIWVLEGLVRRATSFSGDRTDTAGAISASAIPAVFLRIASKRKLGHIRNEKPAWRSPPEALSPVSE